MAISNAIDAGRVSRVLGIKTEFKNLRGGAIVNLPQRIALFAQGNSAAVYPATKYTASSAVDAANRFGYGSPIHLAMLKIRPESGGGVGALPVTIYPLSDAGSSVLASGRVVVMGTCTKSFSAYITVGGIKSKAIVLKIGISLSDLDVLINNAVAGVLEMPVNLVFAEEGDLIVNAKWKGITGNDLHITATGWEESGFTVAITQPSGGLVNPDMAPAIAQMGDIWETQILNGNGIDDDDTLGDFQTEGVARWGATMRKPFCGCYVGNTTASVASATTVSKARKLDYINSQLVAPGSHDLPIVVAAAQMVEIALLANNIPAHDYGSRHAVGITPGTDMQQWDNIERETAVLAGSSTIKVVDGAVRISDVVTFYAPTGVPIPSHRFVVDIVKIANILFNYDLIFANPEWDGAPLVPDADVVSLPEAKQPKMAVAALSTLITSLAENAIISNPEAARKTIRAGINAQNPKRLDVTATLQIAGNTNILSIDFNWGFLFGSA